MWLVRFDYFEIFHFNQWLQCFELDQVGCFFDTFKEIQVAVGYKYNGKLLDSFPADLNVLSNVEVDYKTFAGWETDISKIAKYKEFPENCRRYIEFIEEYVNVPIKWIGTGPGREATIIKSTKN